MRSMSKSASGPAVKRARRRPSLTPRAPKAPQRGASVDPSGFDAGKKVKGRKRHILVDTLGLLLNVVVHPADVQDRDGAFDLLRRSRRLFPFVERIYANGGYRGPKMAGAVARTGVWQIEIVKRPTLARFEILPKRWFVERTFAWISRCRRLAKDFERLCSNHRRLRPPRHDPPHAQATGGNASIVNGSARSPSTGPSIPTNYHGTFQDVVFRPAMSRLHRPRHDPLHAQAAHNHITLNQNFRERLSGLRGQSQRKKPLCRRDFSANSLSRVQGNISAEQGILSD
jgi:transposase